MKIHLTVIGLLCFVAFSKAEQLDEGDRQTEYHRRGHTWPPREEDYIPNTPGWRAIFERRFNQIPKIVDDNEKYNGFMSAVHQSLLCQNFTENGWGLTKAPQV